MKKLRFLVLVIVTSMLLCGVGMVMSACGTKTCTLIIDANGGRFADGSTIKTYKAKEDSYFENVEIPTKEFNLVSGLIYGDNQDIFNYSAYSLTRYLKEQQIGSWIAGRQHDLTLTVKVRWEPCFELEADESGSGYWIVGPGGATGEMVIPQAWNPEIPRQYMEYLNGSSDYFPWKSRILGIQDGALAGNTTITSITFQRFKSFSSTDLVIGEEAFMGCTKLECVDFSGLGQGDTVKVGARAFANCRKLSSVNLPKKGGTNYWYFNDVGEEAFKGCVKLQEVTCGHVGENAFNGCTKLQKVTCGNVGKSAFAGCTSLESASVNYEIGEEAFLGCSNLKDLTVSLYSGVEYVREAAKFGAYAFADCNALENVYLEDPNGKSLIYYWAIISFTMEGDRPINNPLYPVYKNSKTEATHKSRKLYDQGTLVTTLELTKDDRYKEVGVGAFYNYDYLTSVVCSGAKEYAFYDCDQIKKVRIEAQGNAGSGRIEKLAFYDCDSLETVEMGELDLYSGTIGDQAFCSCRALTAFIKGNESKISRFDLGDWAFAYCVNLARFDFQMDNVGLQAFFNCTALKDVTIAGPKIGDGAFLMCELETLTLKGTVNEIGEQAFFGMTSLRTVTFEKTSGWDARLNNGNALQGVDLTNNATAIKYLTVSTLYGGCGDVAWTRK